MATTKLRTQSSARRGLAALAATATLALLAGCSSSPATSSGGAAAPSGTLQMIVSSSDSSDAAFKAVNAAFEKKYPKVKIVFSAIPNANYPAAKSSRLTAGNVDILTADPVQVPKYVSAASKSDDDLSADAGAFVDLTKQPFMKNYTPTLLKAIAYNGKQFTVPTGVSYYTGVYYNKTLFQKDGLTIPTTWSQFVTLANTLKSKGVAPLGIGGKDSWPAGLTMLSAVQGLYPTQADKDALSKGLWKQTVKLTDSTPQTVLDRVKQMYGFAQTNFAGVPYSAIPAGFASQQFAMTPDGTWDNPTIAAAVGSKFSYGYFPIPTSNNAADNKTLGGKLDLQLAIPTSAKNKTAALAYLAFYSKPSTYKTYVKLSGIAPAQPNIPAGSFLNSISSYTSTYSPAWDTIWVANPKSGAAATFPFNYPGVAPMGSASPATAASTSQSDWKAGF